MNSKSENRDEARAHLLAWIASVLARQANWSDATVVPANQRRWLEARSKRDRNPTRVVIVGTCEPRQFATTR